MSQNVYIGMTLKSWPILLDHYIVTNNYSLCPFLYFHPLVSSVHAQQITILYCALEIFYQGIFIR